MAKQQMLPFTGQGEEVDMMEDEGAQTESADNTPMVAKGPHPLKRQRKRTPLKKEPVICVNNDSDADERTTHSRKVE